MFRRQLRFRQWNSLTIALIALIVFCIGAMVVGAGVIAMSSRNQALNLIRVPEDYATIQAAIDAAVDGDIIQVRSGVYNENIILNKAVSLTAESFDQINPVNNTTIIDGQGGAAAVVIPAGLVQMPTLRGFIIRNSGDGILANSPFIVEFNYFLSSTISVNYQMGGGGNNRNNVYFAPIDDAIHLDDVTRPLLIENNRIMYAGDDGIEINLQNTSAPPSLTEVDIWNNMIIGNRGDGVQFIDYAADPQDTNRRFVLWANLIANNARAGVGLMPNGNTVEDYSGADTIEPIRVINNTFFGNDHGISGGDNLVAINNIIAASVTRGAWKVQGPTGSNSVIAFTLFHNNGTDADQSTLGAGIITGQDPLFSASPNPGPDGTWQTVDDDFSGLVLRSGSPAIDKGVIQYTTVSGELIPPNPITGFTGAAPDLGWREFGSPAFITATPSPTLAGTTTPVSPTATVPSLTPLSPTPVTATATVASPTLQPAPFTPTSSVTPTTPPSTATFTATAPPTIIATTTTAPLAILSVNPISAQANTTINLTITGTSFVPGTVVTFEGGQGIASEVVSAQVVNSTTITAVVNVLADSAFGAQVWDVRITTPDTKTAVLLDAFTVVP